MRVLLVCGFAFSKYQNAEEIDVQEESPRRLETEEKYNECLKEEQALVSQTGDSSHFGKCKRWGHLGNGIVNGEAKELYSETSKKRCYEDNEETKVSKSEVSDFEGKDGAEAAEEMCAGGWKTAVSFLLLLS